ncbi:MAG: phosphatase PAP2 family protein [Solirubrobacteraceae bacterium]|nr:phosphatase PAP2 family protein [Solirubrobacteraceae bacterium]
MPDRVRRPLVGAAVSAIFTLFAYLLARKSGAAWWDERILEILAGRLDRHPYAENAHDLRTVFDVGPYILIVLVLLASVLWRGAAALAALAGGMLLAANLSTWALQHRLGDPRVVQILNEPPWMSYWPSGHTTAPFALAIAVWLVSTPRWRPFVAVVGLLVACAAAMTNLVIRAHVPSDLVGGLGVALTWGFLAYAAQQMWPRELSPR